MNEFDEKNIVLVGTIRLLDEGTGEPTGLTMMMVKDVHGSQSFYYEVDDGSYIIPEYTDEEWEFFEEVANNVGWYEYQEKGSIHEDA